MAVGEGNSKLSVSFWFPRCGARGAVKGVLIGNSPAAGVTSEPFTNTCRRPVTFATAEADPVTATVTRTAVLRRAMSGTVFAGVCIDCVISIFATLRSTAASIEKGELPRRATVSQVRGLGNAFHLFTFSFPGERDRPSVYAQTRVGCWLSGTTFAFSPSVRQRLWKR